ncbi:MAG: glycosyltransferase family 2 protein [Nodosilinea sp.]
MNISIILLIFNRPETTKKVIEVIRHIEPSHLFVVADGPRHGRDGDAKKCGHARSVIESIDWKCQVHKNFSEVNLGCAKRVSSGLDWAFSITDNAIILEDDCVPHPSFFQYCDELLTRYADDERVMSISGLSVPASHQRDNYSYQFSHFHRCWGWATWRRAWEHYDYDMRLWPQIVEGNLLNELFPEKRVADFWYKKFQGVYDEKINSWAYRWMLTCWLQSGLSILPAANLISNIGFGLDATNTVNDSFAAQLSAKKMNFPLRHPPYIVRDLKADLYIQRTRHSADFAYRVERKLKKLLNV